MQAANSFDLVTQSNNNLDVYTLLLILWQAMSLAQKQSAVDIVQAFHKNAWDVDCCHALTKALNCNVSDLPTLQPCIFLAMEHPSHIERGIVEQATLTSGIVEDEVAEIESQRVTASSGLLEFVRIPEGVKGLDLLNHQVVFCQRKCADKESKHKISKHLNIKPRTPHQ